MQAALITIQVELSWAEKELTTKRNTAQLHGLAQLSWLLLAKAINECEQNHSRNFFSAAPLDTNFSSPLSQFYVHIFK